MTPFSRNGATLPRPPPPAAAPQESRLPAPQAQAGAPRSFWDLAILALGLNLWVCFALLPAWHLPAPGLVALGLLSAAPSLLALGLLWRHRGVLLLAFPGLLLAIAVFAPQLVGVNVYTPANFVLVALSLLAYQLATLTILPRRPSAPALCRPLEPAPPQPHWRRRFRLYRWLSLLSALFPAVLIFVLFLHPGAQADLQRSYPGRVSEASALFGVLLLALWLGLFQVYFVGPLQAHVHGDPQLHLGLRQLRRLALHPRPRSGFYLGALLLLLAATLLALLRYVWPR